MFENVPVVRKADVVILAVKPSVIPIALAGVKKETDLNSDKLFLSIAMGFSIRQLEQV